MNRVQQISSLGQSIWFDNISRSMIRSGELRKLVETGVTGVTSNPTIFDKAISGSKDYDEQIQALLQQGANTEEVLRSLMVSDIQQACDELAPVYTQTSGKDGFVSVEVTPGKAHDTEATIDEVRELWQRIARPNLMVKIPATREGLPAIEQSIAGGMNINVTLIFAVERYREVAEAYIRGIERRVADGAPVERVASVASVFVSRIDTLADEMLQKKIAADPEAPDAGLCRKLLGATAVANTKMVYQAFRELFHSSRFLVLRNKGARVQRPLWGSTGTKNKLYSDVLYVDTLIGPDTVNTVPPQTFAAILEHGTPGVTIEKDLDEARTILRQLDAVGIDMRQVTDKLEEDGVAAFMKSFDALYHHLEEKEKAFRQVAQPQAHR